ncbi:MAG: DNA alkylation repair protein [Candidatus Woesearchaeota archaeon]
MTKLNDLLREIKADENPKQANLLQGFFKTGKGEYGEGDIFLGLKVPVQRKIADKYKDISLIDIQSLLKSKIHEHRLIALLVLVHKFKKADEKEKKIIFRFYLRNTDHINNWDLVDLSSHKIVGEYLKDKPREILYKLAKSRNLWEKRISIIATFAFIPDHDFRDSLDIAEILLNDKHDLIHKAVGWMLREIGKKDQEVEEQFLKRHYKHMPRTMLRYSIERFDENKRKFYMKK